MPEDTYYLFDVEALNNQKGTRVRAFLYNKDCSTKFVDLDAPHIFSTIRMSQPDAERLAERLRENKNLESANAKIVGPMQSGREKFILQAIGPRETKKFLPWEFITDGRNSADNQLRWRFRTHEFPKVRIAETDGAVHIVPAGQPTTLEELVQLPALVMDWEADKEFQRKKALGFPDKVFEGNEEWTRLTIHALKYKGLVEVASLFDYNPIMHQREFVQVCAKRISELDPPIISSYNVQYDALKPTELPNRAEISDLETVLGKKLFEKYKTQIESRLENAKSALLDLHNRLKNGKNLNSVGRQKIFEHLGLQDLPSKVRNFMLWKIAKAHPLEVEHVLAPSSRRYFPIGVDGSEPKIHAVGGFLRIPHISGRIIVDPMALAFKFYWTPDRKLETVYKFRTGKEYKKTRSYDDVQADAAAAESGDKAKLDASKQYCLEDTLAAEELAELDKPIAFKLAQIFETSARDAQCTSNSTLASGLRDKKFWEKYQTYREDVTKALENFDVREEKYRALGHFGLRFETRRGLFSNKGIALVYASALPHIFYESIARLTKLPFKFLGEEKNRINRMTFLQTFDFLCEEALYDWNRAHSPGEMPLEREPAPNGKNSPEPGRLGADLFLYMHGISVGEADRRFGKVVSALSGLFSENSINVINYNDRFLFLEFVTDEKATYKEKLEKLKACKYLEFYTTSDKVLSGKKGRAIAFADGIVVSPGIDIKGRYGLRTQFEKDTFALFENYVAGKIKSHGLIAQSNLLFKRLASSQIPKEDLIYMAGANFEIDQLSADAMRQERYKALQELVESGAESSIAGKKTAFGYALMGMHKVVSAKEFLQNETRIDYEKYCAEFFGEKTGIARKFSEGTISDYFRSLIPSRKHDVCAMLARFFGGQAGNEDLVEIIGHIPKNSQLDLGKF